MKESEEELKSLLMRVKEESEKAGLKFNIQKMKIMAAAAAAKSLQSCPTLCNPTDGSPPGSSILGFSRQEYWSGLPYPYLENHGIWSHHFRQIDGETENSERLNFLGLQNHCRW